MKTKVLLLFLAIVLLNFNLYSQNLLNSKDLTTFKAELVSDAQVSQIKQELQKRGLSIEDIESQAIAKGMPRDEFLKLKEKINDPIVRAKPKSINNYKSNLNKLNNSNIEDTTESNETYNYTINKKIYGSEIFTSNLAKINTQLATPINYELGPNDNLKLVIYGVQEYSADLIINKEGNIYIENVGEIKLSGMTLEAAKSRIKQNLINTAYPSIKNGKSNFDLSLSELRTIHVNVIGAIKSGIYNVSSFSNVISVLNEAGGPGPIGSYREVQVIRKNKIIAVCDLYKFLEYGDQSQNINLKDNDVVKILPYGNRIYLTGEVKRPGIFEIKENENFIKILQFAGGFTDDSYREFIKVVQKNEIEKSIKDINKNEFSKYFPQGGDLITVSKIINKFKNRVILTGAVNRPDQYELTGGLRISELIKRAGGLKDDAFVDRAELIRKKPNFLNEMISINLRNALNNDTNENLLLKKDDELHISSLIELRDSLTIDIYGEVRKPGKYYYIENLTIKDLILMAGGFTQTANKNIEIARLINYGDKVENNQVTQIIKIEINGDLSFNSEQSNMKLQPLDVITITKKTGFTMPEIISITGQVQNSGKYTLKSRVERVSDIITRSGGLIGEAYGEGSYIRRKRFNIDSLKSDENKTSIELAYTRKFKAKLESERQSLGVNNQTLNSTNFNFSENNSIQPNKNVTLKDTLNLLFKELDDDYYQIAIDINYIMKNPGSELDLVLRDEDEIVIPKVDNRVKISGGVLRPTNIVFRDGLTINDCISAAGGISEYAKRGRAYVIYANGKSNRTKHFGLFRINPAIKPGSEIVLPETDAKKDKPITTIIQFTTVMAQVISALATISLLQK